MLAEFWEFASHFITIEELQATAFITVISIIIIISAYITDKYDKKGE